MSDKAFPDTSEATRKAMRANTGKDTKPEMVLRRLVHGMGYRYRLHRKDLPGKPDLVFGPRRKAIFVHGCFWHQHGCKRSSITPKANAEFWTAKLRRNVERDAAALKALHASGWRTNVVWECETKDRASLAKRIRTFIEET